MPGLNVPAPGAPDGPRRLSWLAEAGAVGRALAAVDWSETPLGPPERWEASLETMLRVMLGSRFSMWMAWGPELTFFCNDAYRRDTLASKYPWALGRPAREVWSEIWEDIAPRIGSVLQTGEASWDERLLLFLERSGFVEESYHTFSYSPLHGDDGEISGMLCVVTEETERVIDQLRLGALRELGSLVGVGQDTDGYLQDALATLGHHGRLGLFAAVYLEEGGDALRLAAAGPGAAAHPALPLRLTTAPATPAGAGGWPVAAALEGETVRVERLTSWGRELPDGGWGGPPQQAAVVPLPAQRSGGSALGVLIVGLNPYRSFDAGYRSFLGLLAAQLAAGVASAQAFESERARAEQLAALDAAKTAFFTNVSHELRTPLTLLLAPAEDLLGDPRPRPAPERRALELIVRNGQRLLGQVNTLLDFSRLEAGHAEPRREATDLAGLTRELVAMFDSSIAAAGLTLELELEPLADPVWVDREMWTKVVFNLVSNALKYTLEGSITVRLDVDGDGGVMLEVSDSGVGIPEEDQPLIFERFHRVAGQTGRTHEGTGIGLALVAELTARHGGTIEVRSRPGAGSTFTVRLPPGDGASVTASRGGTPAPADPDAPSAAPAPLATPRPFLPAGPAPTAGPATPTAGPPVSDDVGRPRILVVDDNADMRAYITGLLASRYAVAVAADGQAALETARAEPPDLILTDVMMPRLDGFELLAALREDPATIGTPVVMLSARAGAEGLLEGLEAGADDYLVKPFTARELLARVAANLELERARRIRRTLERGRRLQEQAERLADVGSWEIDLRTGKVAGSDHFMVMTGLSATELADADYHDVLARVVDPDDLPRVNTALAVAARSGQPFGHETRLADSERWLLVGGESVVGDDGEPVGLRGFIQDITQQRVAQTAIAAGLAAQRVAEREHAIADELQRRLLPTGDFRSPWLASASYYQAGVEGTRAGGDWFDLIDLGGARTAVVIGDVSGRGIRAAALMGQLRAAIRAHAQLDLPPAEALEQLDRLVAELGHGSLVTCIYGIHDHAEARFAYASAGHLPALALEPRDGGPGRVRSLPSPTGPPLGTGSARYGEESVTVAPGATLLLYTDGLVERRRVLIDETLAQLAAALSAYAGPLEGLPEALVRVMGSDDLSDDTAILAIRPRQRAGLRRVELTLDDDTAQVRHARQFCATCCAEWGVPRREAEAAITIVSELVTNAIVYGRPPITLRLLHDPTELVIEVEDTLASIPRRVASAPGRPGGRGLRIVAGLADRWSVRPRAAGKAVWCQIRLGRAQAVGQNSDSPSTSSSSR